MQEQEHVLIEICKDTTWKDGDDHTLLLQFEMQNPFVLPQWTNATFLPFLDQILGVTFKIVIWTCDVHFKFLLFFHAPPQQQLPL